MLLAIDAGNTNVVFALLDGRDIRARWRIATDARRTADEYAVWLNQLLMLEGYKIADVNTVIIATVVPRALHNLQVLAEKYFRTTALIAGQSPLDWGIELDVAEPGSVGADRVVDEMLFRFTHDREIDWMLPGIEPTGKTVEVPLIAIINFRGDKLYHEHIYWDQASVLVQVGLLDPTNLPTAGKATAAKVLDETRPSNELMAKWADSAP